MSTMSIQIDDKKEKKLEEIASSQGKSIGSLVEGLIDQFLEDFYEKNDQAEGLKAIMKVSETSFEEWDNTEDDIYDEL